MRESKNPKILRMSYLEAHLACVVLVLLFSTESCLILWSLSKCSAACWVSLNAYLFAKYTAPRDFHRNKLCRRGFELHSLAAFIPFCPVRLSVRPSRSADSLKTSSFEADKKASVRQVDAETAVAPFRIESLGRLMHLFVCAVGDQQPLAASSLSGQTN